MQKRQWAKHKDTVVTISLQKLINRPSSHLPDNEFTLAPSGPHIQKDSSISPMLERITDQLRGIRPPFLRRREVLSYLSQWHDCLWGRSFHLWHTLYGFISRLFPCCQGSYRIRHVPLYSVWEIVRWAIRHSICFPPWHISLCGVRDIVRHRVCSSFWCTVARHSLQHTAH